MRDAVRGTDSPAQALATLASALVPRIPQTVALVATIVEATIRSIQLTKLAAREVPRTTSG